MPYRASDTEQSWKLFQEEVERKKEIELEAKKGLIEEAKQKMKKENKPKKQSESCYRFISS